MGLGITALFTPSAALVESLETLPTLMSFALRAEIIYPLTYHLVGGVRHLWWDTTLKGLNLKDVNNSSIAIMGVAGVLGTVLLFLSAD